MHSDVYDHDDDHEGVHEGVHAGYLHLVDVVSEGPTKFNTTCEGHTPYANDHNIGHLHLHS